LTGRKKGSAGGDPTGVPRCETAAGDHMEHAEEADLGAEVPGIVGDL